MDWGYFFSIQVLFRWVRNIGGVHLVFHNLSPYHELASEKLVGSYIRPVRETLKKFTSTAIQNKIFNEKIDKCIRMRYVC